MENTLGKYLHSERTKRNMSLREFSELLGISHTYLNKLENGKDPRNGKPVSPTIETLKEISKALHVSLEYLLEVSGYVKGENIVLIDDIYTTGSTLDEAARVLKKAGAENVYFLTVSIGQGIWYLLYWK